MAKFDKLIGREQEARMLNEYINSDKSEFIAIYGRRRVGKTYLIRNVVGDRACFSLTGMENAGLKEQLTNFYITFRKKKSDASIPSSWLEAFDQLESWIETLRKGKKIIVVDELPWLDTVRSSFVAAFEHFWNDWASARNDIKLIVCGSATSWMTDNIINNRGGLHNRKTHQIYVAPFTLAESKQYFKAYGFRYGDKDVAECHMVMGGVAYYYSLMLPTESVAQNIDRLFFHSNGELSNEFENLYRSLFKKSGDHIRIVTALASKNRGLTRKQLIEITTLNNNNKLTKNLDELEKCGFIRSYTPFDGAKRDVLFQLIDSYTLFYFHFIKGNNYHDEQLWTHSLNSARYRAWGGYAFEMLCLNHIMQIKKALGISGIQSRVCSWIWKGDEENQGAQIDLLIDRADQTVNVCEIKFARAEYRITKSDYENIENKIETLLQHSKTKKSLMLTLITCFGLSVNQYSGRVQNQVTLADIMNN
ncbi:MAG: ATP-binding protein [Bacteroidales bacterium]|nr:ATP-binding protein [Bacteroidales bacterium]